MSNVLQDWLQELPWKQQSILFSGLRGPDVPNCPNIKAVNRWMRTVTQHNADPSKNYMREERLPHALNLCEELEFLPCHYVHHFADSLAVIAYNHPEVSVCLRAGEYHFRIAEELFHFLPEQPNVFRLRHRDKVEENLVADQLWKATQEEAYKAYIDAVHFDLATPSPSHSSE